MNTRIRQITIKSISFVLAACLLMQPCFTGISSASSSPPSFLPNLSVAESIATVESYFNAGSQSKRIHLIKDAHTNASCQIHTAKLLESLTGERPIKSIYLEAGEGDLSLSFLKSAPLRKRQEVGLEFIQKGWMQGSEYFDLTTDKSIRLFGVENQEFYQESVELYDELLQTRQEAQRYLNQMSVSVNVLKHRVYHQELKAFDQTVADYQSGILGWTDYVDYLHGLMSRFDKYYTVDSSVSEYRRIRDLERQIDFEKAQMQVEYALENLTEAQRQSWIQYANPDQQKLHQITAPNDIGTDQYLFLEELLQTSPETQKIIKNDLKKYFRYLGEVKKLDLKKHMQSVEAMEKHLYLLLSVTPAEARLHEADQKLQMLDRLIHLQADPELMQRYLSEKKLFTAGFITALINRIAFDQDVLGELAAPIDTVLERAVETAEEFYRLTEARDEYFVKTMTEQIQQNSEQEAALIVGGYHGPNIENLLRQQGLSYAVWIPAVSHETDQNRYEKILLSQHLQTTKRTVFAKSKVESNSAVMVQQLMMGLRDGRDSGKVFRLGEALEFSPEEMAVAASRLSESVLSNDAVDRIVNRLKSILGGSYVDIEPAVRGMQPLSIQLSITPTQPDRLLQTVTWSRNESEKLSMTTGGQILLNNLDAQLMLNHLSHSGFVIQLDPLSVGIQQESDLRKLFKELPQVITNYRGGESGRAEYDFDTLVIRPIFEEFFSNDTGQTISSNVVRGIQIQSTSSRRDVDTPVQDTTASRLSEQESADKSTVSAEETKQSDSAPGFWRRWIASAQNLWSNLTAPKQQAKEAAEDPALVREALTEKAMNAFISDLDRKLKVLRQQASRAKGLEEIDMLTNAYIEEVDRALERIEQNIEFSEVLDEDLRVQLRESGDLLIDDLVKAFQPLRDELELDQMLQDEAQIKAAQELALQSAQLESARTEVRKTLDQQWAEVNQAIKKSKRPDGLEAVSEFRDAVRASVLEDNEKAIYENRLQNALDDRRASVWQSRNQRQHQRQFKTELGQSAAKDLKEARDDLKARRHATAWAKFDEIIEALSDIETIADINLRPYFSQAMLGAAQAVSRTNPAKVPNKFDIALEYLDRALQEDPENLFLNGEKAWQLYYSERYEDAIEQADLILKSLPKNSSALTVRVVSMMRIAKTKTDIARVESAIEWMEQALRETQDSASKNRLQNNIQRIQSEWKQIKKTIADSDNGSRLADSDVPEILNDGIVNSQRKKDYFSVGDNVLVNTRFLSADVQQQLSDEGLFVRDTDYVRAQVTELNGWFFTVTYYASDGTSLLDLSTEETISRDVVWKSVAGSRLSIAHPDQFGEFPEKLIGGPIRLMERDLRETAVNGHEFLQKSKSYQKIESGLHNFWTRGFKIADISFRIDTRQKEGRDESFDAVAIGEPDHTLMVYNPEDSNAIPTGPNKGWIELRSVEMDENPVMIRRGKFPQGLVRDPTTPEIIEMEGLADEERWGRYVQSVETSDLKRLYVDMEPKNWNLSDEDLQVLDSTDRLIITFFSKDPITGENRVVELYLPHSFSKESFTAVSRAYRADLSPEEARRVGARVESREGAEMHAAGDHASIENIPYLVLPKYSMTDHMMVEIIGPGRATLRNLGGLNPIAEYSLIGPAAYPGNQVLDAAGDMAESMDGSIVSLEEQSIDLSLVEENKIPIINQHNRQINFKLEEGKVYKTYAIFRDVRKNELLESNPVFIQVRDGLLWQWSSGEWIPNSWLYQGNLYAYYGSSWEFRIHGGIIMGNDVLLPGQHAVDPSEQSLAPAYTIRLSPTEMNTVSVKSHASGTIIRPLRENESDIIPNELPANPEEPVPPPSFIMNPLQQEDKNRENEVEKIDRRVFEYVGVKFSIRLIGNDLELIVPVSNIPFRQKNILMSKRSPAPHSIGRDTGNDSIISVEGASRTGLSIIREGSDYYLEDIGTRNGVFVDGRKISKEKLNFEGSRLSAEEAKSVAQLEDALRKVADSYTDYSDRLELTAGEAEELYEILNDIDFSQSDSITFTNDVDVILAVSGNQLKVNAAAINTMDSVQVMGVVLHAAVYGLKSSRQAIDAASEMFKGLPGSDQYYLNANSNDVPELSADEQGRALAESRNQLFDLAKTLMSIGLKASQTEINYYRSLHEATLKEYLTRSHLSARNNTVRLHFLNMAEAVGEGSATDVKLLTAFQTRSLAMLVYPGFRKLLQQMFRAERPDRIAVTPQVKDIEYFKWLYQEVFQYRGARLTDIHEWISDMPYRPGWVDGTSSNGVSHREILENSEVLKDIIQFVAEQTTDVTQTKQVMVHQVGLGTLGSDVDLATRQAEQIIDEQAFNFSKLQTYVSGRSVWGSRQEYSQQYLGQLPRLRFDFNGRIFAGNGYDISRQIEAFLNDSNNPLKGMIRDRNRFENVAGYLFDLVLHANQIDAIGGQGPTIRIKNPKSISNIQLITPTEAGPNSFTDGSRLADSTKKIPEEELTYSAVSEKEGREFMDLLTYANSVYFEARSFQQNRGQEQTVEADFREAIDAYELALEIKPQDARILRRLAIAYQGLGDDFNSIRVRKLLAEADPEDELNLEIMQNLTERSWIHTPFSQIGNRVIGFKGSQSALVLGKVFKGEVEYRVIESGRKIGKGILKTNQKIAANSDGTIKIRLNDTIKGSAPWNNSAEFTLLSPNVSELVEWSEALAEEAEQNNLKFYGPTTRAPDELLAMRLPNQKIVWIHLQGIHNELQKASIKIWDENGKPSMHFVELGDRIYLNDAKTIYLDIGEMYKPTAKKGSPLEVEIFTTAPKGTYLQRAEKAPESWVRPIGSRLTDDAFVSESNESLEYVAAGETILTQGEAGDSVYIIHQGEVEIFVQSEDQTTATLVATLASPDIFGEMSDFYSGKRTATAVALTDVVLHKMSRNEWIDYLDSITTDDQMYFKNMVLERSVGLINNKWDLEVDFPSLNNPESQVKDWEGYSQEQFTEWGKLVYDTLDAYMKSFTKEGMADDVLAAYMRSGDYSEVQHVHLRHFNLRRAAIRGAFSGVRKKIFDWTHQSKLDAAIEVLSRRSDAPWIGEIKRAAYYTRSALVDILSDAASVPEGTSVDAAEELMTQRAKEALTKFYQLVNTYVDRKLITPSYATLVKGRTVPWVLTDFRELGGFVEQHKFTHDEILPEFNVEGSRLSDLEFIVDDASSRKLSMVDPGTEHEYFWTEIPVDMNRGANSRSILELFHASGIRIEAYSLDQLNPRFIVAQEPNSSRPPIYAGLAVSIESGIDKDILATFKNDGIEVDQLIILDFHGLSLSQNTSHLYAEYQQSAIKASAKGNSVVAHKQEHSIRVTVEHNQDNHMIIIRSQSQSAKRAVGLTQTDGEYGRMKKFVTNQPLSKGQINIGIKEFLQTLSDEMAGMHIVRVIIGEESPFAETLDIEDARDMGKIVDTGSTVVVYYEKQLPNRYLNSSIEYIGLSKIKAHRLREQNIISISDLMGLSVDEILQTEGFNSQDILLIRNYLSEIGGSLRGDDQGSRLSGSGRIEDLRDAKEAINNAFFVAAELNETELAGAFLDDADMENSGDSVISFVNQKYLPSDLMQSFSLIEKALYEAIGMMQRQNNTDQVVEGIRDKRLIEGKTILDAIKSDMKLIYEANLDPRINQQLIVEGGYLPQAKAALERFLSASRLSGIDESKSEWVHDDLTKFGLSEEYFEYRGTRPTGEGVRSNLFVHRATGYPILSRRINFNDRQAVVDRINRLRREDEFLRQHLPPAYIAANTPDDMLYELDLQGLGYQNLDEAVTDATLIQKHITEAKNIFRIALSRGLNYGSDYTKELVIRNGHLMLRNWSTVRIASRLATDPILIEVGERFKSIADPNDASAVREWFAEFKQAGFEGQEPSVLNSYDWIMDGQGEFARPLPDNLVTTLIPIKAIAFYLLNKSLSSGFHPDDLDYLRELIEHYNLNRAENLPLDIPSALNYALFHLYPNDAYFAQMATQLTQLPEPFARQSVALASLLKAMHLDGWGKEDGSHELRIIQAYLEYALQSVQSLGADPADVKALEIGTIRLLVLLEKYLRLNFEVSSAATVAQIRDEIPADLKTGLNNVVEMNAAQIAQILNKINIIELTSPNFNEIIETDPYLLKLSVSAYWPEAVDEIFTERSEFTLYEVLLNRENALIMQYLNSMLAKFKTLSLKKLYLDTLEEMQRKGSDVAQKIKSINSEGLNLDSSIQYGYVNGAFIHWGHHHIQFLRQHLSRINTGDSISDSANDSAARLAQTPQEEAESDVMDLYQSSDLETLRSAYKDAVAQLRKVIGNREIEAYWRAFAESVSRLIDKRSDDSNSQAGSSGGRLSIDSDPLTDFAKAFSQSDPNLRWTNGNEETFESTVTTDIGSEFRRVPAAKNRIRLIVTPAEPWRQEQIRSGLKDIDFLQQPRNAARYQEKLLSPLTAPKGSFGQIILNYYPSAQLLNDQGESLILGPTLVVDAVQNRIGYDDINPKLRHDLDLWRDHALRHLDAVAEQQGLNLVVRHPVTIRSAKLVPVEQMIRNYYRVFQSKDKYGLNRLGWNAVDSSQDPDAEDWSKLSGDEWMLSFANERGSQLSQGFFIPSLRTRASHVKSAARLVGMPSEQLIQDLDVKFNLGVSVKDGKYTMDYSRVLENAAWPMDRFRSKQIPSELFEANLVYPLENSVPLSVRSASSVNNYQVTNTFLLNISKIQSADGQSFEESPIIIKLFSSEAVKRQAEIWKEVFIMLKGYPYFPQWRGAIIQNGVIIGYGMQPVLGVPAGINEMVNGEGVMEAIEELWNREGLDGAPEAIRTRVTDRIHIVLADVGNLNLKTPRVKQEFADFEQKTNGFLASWTDDASDSLGDGALGGARLTDWNQAELIHEFVLSVSSNGIGSTFGLATDPQLTASGVATYSTIHIKGGLGNQISYEVDGVRTDIDDYKSERRRVLDSKEKVKAQELARQEEAERNRAIREQSTAIDETNENLIGLGVAQPLDIAIEIPLNELAVLAQQNIKEFQTQFEFALNTLGLIKGSQWGRLIQFHLSGIEAFSEKEQRIITSAIQKRNRSEFVTLNEIPGDVLAGYLLTANAGLSRKEFRINSVVDGVGSHSVPDWYRGIGYIIAVAWDVVPESRRSERFDTQSPETYQRVPSDRLLEVVNSRIGTAFDSPQQYLSFVANQGVFDLKSRAIRPLLQKLNHLIRTIRTMITMTSISA